MTLSICLKAVGLREFGSGDDRLAAVVERLGQDDERDAYESEQCGVSLRVYDLKAKRVRIDSTTAKG